MARGRLLFQNEEAAYVRSHTECFEVIRADPSHVDLFRLAVAGKSHFIQLDCRHAAKDPMSFGPIEVIAERSVVFIELARGIRVDAGYVDKLVRMLKGHRREHQCMHHCHQCRGSSEAQGKRGDDGDTEGKIAQKRTKYFFQHKNYSALHS